MKLRRIGLCVTSVLAGALWVQAQSYQAGTNGWENVDPTRPLGSEPGTHWAPALRETKRAAMSAFMRQHESNGVHAAGAIDSAAIATESITWDHLSVDLRRWLLNATNPTNGTSTSTLLVSTNSGVIASYPGFTLLATLDIPSNACTSILLSWAATPFYDAFPGDDVSYLQILTNDVVALTQTNAGPSFLRKPLSGSLQMAAQNTNVIVTVFGKNQDNSFPTHGGMQVNSLNAHCITFAP